MTEKSMVEKVARALADRRGGIFPTPWEDLPVTRKMMFWVDARAAIEAMFTPTLAMMDAAETEHAHWNVDDADERLENSEAWVRNTYRAAITEALKG